MKTVVLVFVNKAKGGRCVFTIEGAHRFMDWLAENNLLGGVLWLIIALVLIGTIIVKFLNRPK